MPILLAMLPLPDPPNVRVRLFPVILPVLAILMSPALAIMLAGFASLISPLYVAASCELFVNAPPSAMPVPFNTSGSSVARLNPLRSREPPVLTVVPSSIVPRGVFTASPADPNLKVPALMDTSPWQVLAPESVHVPVPDLVIVPVPVPIMLATVPFPEPPNVKP